MRNETLIENSAYSSVYQVLDDVCFARTVPAGARGAMFAAIDGLRRVSAPAQHVALAECIAVALHRLEWALRNANEAEEAAIRGELQVLGASWLQTPLCLTMH